MILVFNVEKDKVEGGGIRQFLSRKGDQNYLNILTFRGMIALGVQMVLGYKKLLDLTNCSLENRKTNANVTSANPLYHLIILLPI